jgi:ribosomal protein L16 Arg81 hydroxylase
VSEETDSREGVEDMLKEEKELTKVEALKLLRTQAKNILFKSSAMTLNYEPEEEPPEERLDARAGLSLPSVSNRGTW